MNLSLLPREPLPECRPYQLDALERGSVAIGAGASSVLLCMPTGTGKTRTAVEACVRHHALGGLPLCVAPRRELVSQMTATLERAGLEPGHNVFVDTIQGLLSRGRLIPQASLVVWDEARHYVADGWSELHRVLADAVHLGLDATPERTDGRGLGGMFEVLIEAISVRAAIAAGYLVPCDVIRPDRPLPAGDLAQDPLEIYKAKAPNTSAVVFCRSVEHAKEEAARFSAAGFSAAAVWGEMPSSERDSALAAFARGELSVLTNMHLLTEGWDAPITETVILARHFPTPGAMIQAAGRGLRTHKNKTSCKLLDLTGCTHIHGDPDEPRVWNLHGQASTRVGQGAELGIRFCPICGAVAEPKKPCPSCGYEGEERRKRAPRVLGLPMDRFARQRQESDEDKAKKLAFYLHDARSKGRHMYSALKRFEGVYGHMPTPNIKRLARRTV
jgi:DNA repair protein RadD